MDPDTGRFEGFTAEVSDFAGLLGVWTLLAFPLAGLGAALVEALSISVISQLGGGLLFGTLAVATLEVLDRRPALGLSATFCLVYLVLSVATIAFAGLFTDALGTRVGETLYLASIDGLAALLTFAGAGARVWAAGEGLARRLLRLPERREK